MTEKICRTCKNWIPNGGVLGIGYCTAKKWTYRKPTQSCNDDYEEIEQPTNK